MTRTVILLVLNADISFKIPGSSIKISMEILYITWEKCFISHEQYLSLWLASWVYQIKVGPKECPTKTYPEYIPIGATKYSLHFSSF